MLPDIRPPACLSALSGAMHSAAVHLRAHLHGPRLAAPSSATRLSSQLQPVSRDARTLRGAPVRALSDIVDDLQRPSLTGRWHKDRGASDAMDEACDMVALPWLFRQALVVLNTLELEDTPQYFATNLKAGGVMDVVERCALLYFFVFLILLNFTISLIPNLINSQSSGSPFTFIPPPPQHALDSQVSLERGGRGALAAGQAAWPPHRQGGPLPRHRGALHRGHLGGPLRRGVQRHV